MIRRPRRVDSSNHSISTENGDFDFILKRSTGRRNLTICIDEKAEVSVSVPYRIAMRHVEEFIHERSEWIHKKLKEAKYNYSYVQSKNYDQGGEFLFLGQKYPINVLEDDIKIARVHFNRQGWHFIIPYGLDAEQRQKLIKRRLFKWYRAQAEEILAGRVFHYARQIGHMPEKVSIRTQKRMWGCCDYCTRSIYLNWQIILSPMDVLDYVVIHEICHLIVPNHSKRFWNQVKRHMPDYEKHKKWLKDNFLEMLLPQ